MLFKRLSVLFFEFATLILFWAVYWPFGIKPAIAAVVVYVIADAIRRRVQHVAFTRLYILVTTLTIVFVAFDLIVATPFMIQYEAVITNFILGGAFVAGSQGARPMLQNMAEDWTGEPFPPRADIRHFFMLFTLLWAFYFVAKAALYLWIALNFPLAQALAIRAAIGIPSLLAMVALSTQGRYLFLVCRALGWLPPEPAVVEANVAQPPQA
jgi:intracellular septation protein A